MVSNFIIPCDLYALCANMFSMQTYWIIGGGHFGRLAARNIHRKQAGSDIIIIDRQPDVCEQLELQSFESVCADGIGYLETNLTSPDHPDWLIPSIPLHVAYEWIKSKVSRHFKVVSLPIPQELNIKLPNPFQVQSNQLYISNADFTCPENCSEPDEICTHTGQPRPRNLNRYLNKFRHGDFKSIVVFSQQLYPGVGGYTPKALFEALNKVESLPDQILLGTACRCHGVVNAFRLLPKD
jgi:hypothetical protein